MHRALPLATLLLATALLARSAVADETTALARAQALVARGDLGEALAILRPLATANDAPTAILIDAARLALAVRDPERALGWLERASERPDAGEAPRLLGLLRVERGELFPAYLRLRPWIDAHPDDVTARLAAALCAVELDRLTDADTLLAVLPENHQQARLLRGDVLVRRTESDAAITMLEPLLATTIPPAMDSQLRRLLARAYLGARRPGDTVTLLSGKTDDSAPLALLLSEALYHLGDVEAALDALGAHVGGPPTVARERGRLLILAGRNHEAVTALEHATRGMPMDREAWQHLSRARFAAGRRREALAAAAEARRLAQADQPVSQRQSEQMWRLDNPMEERLRQALAQRDAGDPEHALSMIREEIVLQPRHPRLRLLASGLLHAMGRGDEALAEAEKAVALAPGLADAYVRRGIARLGLGQIAQAETDLRTALERQPGHPGATNQLAIILVERQALDEARALLEDLLVADPDNTVARDNLERLRQQTEAIDAGGAP